MKRSELKWEIFEEPILIKDYPLTVGEYIRVMVGEGTEDLLVGDVNDSGGLCDDCSLSHIYFGCKIIASAKIFEAHNEG